VVKKGVNFALAEKLGLQNLEFISYESGSKLYHVAVYVPKDYMEQVANSVFEAGAGVIGNYSHCLNDYEVSGQFKPLAGSNPAIGKTGKLEKITECKLEFFVDSFNLDKVISAMKSVHPYETPAYAIYPQEKQSENFGLGLIGELENEQTIQKFSQFVKKNLEAPFIKLWLASKNLNSEIKKIAICGGSGSSLLYKVYGRADIFVSSGFDYHTLLNSKNSAYRCRTFFTRNIRFWKI